jgi:pimeloyl-ACP methyl ester carboxylesterase
MALSVGAAAPAGDRTVEVGGVTVHRCQGHALCGILPRPLDPAGVVSGTVPIYFEFYRHTNHARAKGTLVAVDGGPGYPTTDSRDDYLALFGPLRASYDVVLMDNRGTGRSGAIDCQELERARQLTEEGIGACGRVLGAAAPLYSDALASDDLAALLQTLGVQRIGLYGNSSGTYFAQVFALRHPDRVRALVLDGAYPLSGPDYGWYPHYAPATRRKFNTVCARSPDCRAIPGSSIEHITPAIERLRAQPFAAHVRYGDGRVLDFTADANALATVMFAGSPAYASVRELDAAARAFQGGDRLPLLRLMAETLGSVDSRDPAHDARKFSAGLAAAVFCEDYPQIFDMHLAPEERLAARNRIIAARKASAPDTYAPFTIEEYRRMPLDYAFIDQCVRWPMTGDSSPLTFDAAAFPAVPVLVLSGELDNMTSIADGDATAAQFPRARHIVMANSLHVNALPRARSECAANLVRQFMADLSLGDEECAAAIPPVPLVPRFARHARELVPARALAGNQAGDEALRLVSAALFTSADVISRAMEAGAGKGVGLRGGTFTIARLGAGYRLTLEKVRWTDELATSGQIDWPGRSGVVHAQLELRAPELSGRLELSWPQGVSDARASATGTVGGRAIAAEAPAP